ncbi:hypothetical protein HU200_002006 [Digitaria exilis]|uniref:Uncharacterized protein n=1 Tax=Digitaria exilis TaxID=1010633 RepID=A0A835KVI5_9POAL|nr:hypothetical protein HU200_002006 [Digitaria exilis]
MGIEAKCGSLAVAAGATVRRPLQPRDTNVAASTVVTKAVSKPKVKPKAVRRLASPSPLPLPFPLPLPPPVVKGAESGVAVVPVAEVSLAEELERARERRGRLREARERTEREMDGRAVALDREAAEWERRAEEQRRLVAELMRLIGMPEVSQPAVLHFMLFLTFASIRFDHSIWHLCQCQGSTSTASTLPAEVGAESCSDQESGATGVTKEPATTIEITS